MDSGSSPQADSAGSGHFFPLRRIRQAHRRRIRQAHRRRIRQAHRRQAQDTFLPFGGFGRLTAGKLRTPNFARGDTKTFRALRRIRQAHHKQAQDTKFRRRRYKNFSGPSASSGHQISPEAKFGGGGGSRTRVRKHSTRASTYLS